VSVRRGERQDDDGTDRMAIAEDRQHHDSQLVSQRTGGDDLLVTFGRPSPRANAAHRSGSSSPRRAPPPEPGRAASTRSAAALSWTTRPRRSTASIASAGMRSARANKVSHSTFSSSVNSSISRCSMSAAVATRRATCGPGLLLVARHIDHGENLAAHRVAIGAPVQTHRCQAST